eukprot:3381584-Rhodomonas_salina.2
MNVDEAIFYVVPDANDFFRSVEFDPIFSDGFDSPACFGEEDKKPPTVKHEHSSDSEYVLSARTTPSPSNNGGIKKRNYKRRALRLPSAWSPEEETVFLAALAQFGLDHPKSSGHMSVGLGPGVARHIAEMIGSRTPSQVRSHAQKHFERLHKMQNQSL